MSKRYWIGYVTDCSVIEHEIGRSAHDIESNGSRYSTIKSARSAIRVIRRTFSDRHPREFMVFDSWDDPIINPLMNGEEFVPCVHCEL